MVWFTADEHMDHEMAIFYCNRPFDKLHKMNHTIINNFNSVVMKDDITYHLGDYTLRGPENHNMVRNWIHRLNGTHVLILGNHDKLAPFSYVSAGFQSVHTSLDVEEFYLTHDPAMCKHMNRVCIAGHVHILFHYCANVINVGVDVNEFKPISIDSIRRIVNDGKVKIT